MSAATRAAARLVRRCGEGAEWCMQEQARLRGELPGVSPYTHEQLETWARSHAEVAFHLSAIFTGDPPARFAHSLDPSPTSPGGHTLGRSRPGDGSNPSPCTEDTP